MAKPYIVGKCIISSLSQSTPCAVSWKDKSDDKVKQATHKIIIFQMCTTPQTT